MDNILLFQSHISNEHNLAILYSIFKKHGRFSTIYTFDGYPVDIKSEISHSCKHIDSSYILSPKNHLSFLLKYPHKYIISFLFFLFYSCFCILLFPVIGILLRKTTFPHHKSFRFPLLLRRARIYETYVGTNGSGIFQFSCLLKFQKTVLLTFLKSLILSCISHTKKSSETTLFISHHNYLGFLLFDAIKADHNYTQAAGCIKFINDNLYDEPDAFFVGDFPNDRNLLDQKSFSISNISKERDPSSIKSRLSVPFKDKKYLNLNKSKYFVLVLNRLNDSPFYRFSDRLFANYFQFAKYTINFCASHDIPLVIAKHPHSTLDSFAENEIYKLCARLRKRNKYIIYDESWENYISSNLLSIITFDGSVILESVAIGINPVTIAFGACRDLAFVHRPHTIQNFNSLLLKRTTSLFRTNPTTKPISLYRYFTSYSSVGCLKPVHGSTENRDRIRMENQKLFSYLSDNHLIRQSIRDLY